MELCGVGRPLVCLASQNASLVPHNAERHRREETRWFGFVATFISILVAAIIFAMNHQGGSGTTEGARFGVLIGIFLVCAFVLHNYVNLNVGLKLALMQAAAYFVQWTIIGIVIGLIYKPPAKP